MLAFDTGWSWEVSADDPYVLFYTYAIIEQQTLGYKRYHEAYRHSPKATKPAANILYADGHAAGPVDLLSTCTGKFGLYDEKNTLLTWSATGK